jgi:hypothetical protein
MRPACQALPRRSIYTAKRETEKREVVNCISAGESSVAN